MLFLLVMLMLSRCYEYVVMTKMLISKLPYRMLEDENSDVQVQVLQASNHINPKLSVRPSVTLSSRSRTSYGSATGTSR